MYTWKWDLDNCGWSEVNLVDYTLGQNKKLEYVEKYLSPSIHYSHCGWDHCVYYVLKREDERVEYIALYPDEDNQGGRYINVTGNSLGAIAEATWDNVFN